MPRIDDYKQACELGKKQLLERNPDLVARFSGAVMNRGKDSGMVLSLPFLNRTIAVTWGDFRMRFEETGGEVPIQQQILLLHYLRQVDRHVVGLEIHFIEILRVRRRGLFARPL